jgi:hypothetical protein
MALAVVLALIELCRSNGLSIFNLLLRNGNPVQTGLQFANPDHAFEKQGQIMVKKRFFSEFVEVKADSKLGGRIQCDDCF